MPKISADQIISILQASGMVPEEILEQIGNIIINKPDSTILQDIIAANLLSWDCIKNLQSLLVSLEMAFAPNQDGISQPEQTKPLEPFMLSVARKKDILFARKALLDGICQVENVNECFAEQAEIKKNTGKNLLIGQIMVKNHLLAVDQFAKIHRAIEQHFQEEDWNELFADERKLRFTYKKGLIRLIEGHIPKQFGSYKILEEIARGGMGVVYKAWDGKLKRPVALKVLKAWENPPREEIQRFHREARLAASLNHPNIVSIYDAGNEDGVHYFTMDFVEGRTVSEYLANEQTNIREKLVIIREIALALDYAHSRGVIHRDVKPGNIILDVTKRALLTDFGLAKGINTLDSRRLTKSGEAIGTPTYMSPEQAQGKDKIDARSDIYSLGAVLYEMITNKPPFEGNAVGAILSAVMYDEPISPSKINTHLHQDVETICLKAMAKEPSHRYLTAKEMAEDIDRFLYGNGIKAKPTPMLKKIWRKLTRNITTTVAFIAFLGIGSAFFAGLWKQHLLYKPCQFHFNMGKLYLKQGYYPAALKAFSCAKKSPVFDQKIQALLRYQSKLYLHKGALAYRRGKNSRSQLLMAHQYFWKAMICFPSDSRAYSGIAKVYTALQQQPGGPEIARNWFQQLSRFSHKLSQKPKKENLHE